MRRGVPSLLTRALQRHPVLVAEWLSSYNRAQRLRHDGRTLLAVVLGGVIAISLFVAGALRYRTELSEILTYLATHEVWAGVLAALYVSLQVLRWRVRAEQRHALSWLAAAPANPGLPRSALLWRTLVPLFVQLAVVITCLLVIGMWSVLGDQLWLLMDWILGGSGVGAVMGWWRGGRGQTAQLRYEDSRYLRRVRDRNPTHRPSLAALSRLPVARALAWYRPENARLFVLIVIATMPAGTSALAGGCALLVALLTSYASTLTRSVLQTATEAAQWLRATPIPFLQFAGPIVCRALLHQAVVSVAVAGLLMQLGAKFSGVAYLVLLWLSLVLMCWCVWLQGCFRGERPLLKAVSSVAAALGVEQLARGVGIGCAVVWTCWNLRTRPA